MLRKESMCELLSETPSRLPERESGGKALITSLGSFVAACLSQLESSD